MIFKLILIVIMSTAADSQPTIYDHSIRLLNSEEELNLNDFRGKKILFVNVASKCGFTKQYEGLEALHQQYKDDLVIIGFPCNQFLGQEPGSEEKIANFCSLNFGVTFPLTEKIKVKGKDAHDIYKWLTSKELNGVKDFKVSWNFNKFLIDEDGDLIAHFPSKVKPLDKVLVDLL